jgi:phage tail-like protein
VSTAKTTDPAVTVNFSVKIDNHDLGAFQKCDGLSFEVEILQQAEGGNNTFIHQLPGRIKYSNVKFTRALNADSAKVATWFSQMTVPIKRTTAEIVAYTLDGKRVTRWGLQGVIPVRWSGPSLDVGSPGVATETLEIAHHGFLAM